METQSASPNIQKLVVAANELHAYVESIPYGATQQKAQAKAILHEIEKTLKTTDEFCILRVFEASIIPKLIKLAKDISMYKRFTGEGNSQPRVVVPDAITMNAYEPFRKEISHITYDSLPPEEQSKIDSLFTELYSKLSVEKE